MQNLNFPQYAFKLKEQGGKKYIFDNWRKKWVVLTPEEWVRQHVLYFLVEERDFPRSLMAVEKSLLFNTLPKRCDIVVYDRHYKPLLLVECKAPNVVLQDSVFAQIARYNYVLQVPYLLVSNGLVHYFCRINYEKGSLEFADNVPFYQALNAP